MPEAGPSVGRALQTRALGVEQSRQRDPPRAHSGQRAGWVGGVQELVGGRGTQSEPGACGQFGLGWAMSKGPGPSTRALRPSASSARWGDEGGAVGGKHRGRRLRAGATRG